jgi:hypothetical protein
MDRLFSRRNWQASQKGLIEFPDGTGTNSKEKGLIFGRNL